MFQGSVFCTMDESGDSRMFLPNSLFGNHKKPRVTLSPVRLQNIKGIRRVSALIPSSNFMFCNRWTLFLVEKASLNDEIFDSDKNFHKYGGVSWSVSQEQIVEPVRPLHYSHTHSKKVIQHALLQQAKRRRKNTKIAASTSAVPRHFSQTSKDSTPLLFRFNSMR